MVQREEDRAERELHPRFRLMTNEEELEQRIRDLRLPHEVEVGWRLGAHHLLIFVRPTTSEQAKNLGLGSLWEYAAAWPLEPVALCMAEGSWFRMGRRQAVGLITDTVYLARVPRLFTVTLPDWPTPGSRFELVDKMPNPSGARFARWEEGRVTCY